MMGSKESIHARWVSRFTQQIFSRRRSFTMKKIMTWVLAVGSLLVPAGIALSLETITVALPSKSFQFVIFPLAQERGYMKEEGIDLKIAVMGSTIGIQAVLSGDAQFTGSGSSALVAVTKGDAPLRTVLAVNDRVLQWLMARPEYKSLEDLKNKKIAVSSVAAISTFMFKKVAPKYGLDANKEVTFLAMGASNRLASLLSGAVAAGMVGTEDRYAALDKGMKELMYLGKEVKNSWGTVAVSEVFINDKPKLMAGFMRALLKALRVVKQERETTIDAIATFSGIKKELAARTYDEIIGTFTANGIVDEETQRNDLDIVREIVKAKKEVPIERAYDFSFAAQADKELTRAGWRP
jgi:ABC-type nitrate/sulfonate/bicarbonate transport system substrate-binding protein